MQYEEEHLISFRGLTLLALLLSGLGLFFTYSSHQSVAFQNEEIKTTLALQKEEISSLKEDIDFLRFESEGKVEDITKKLEQEELLRKTIDSKRETQSQIDQQKISSLETRLSETTSTQDLSSIIKNWESRVAYIECDFVMKNSYLHYSSNGSGVVFKFGSEPIKVLTNRHVLLEDSNLYDLNSCVVRLSGSKNSFFVSVDDIEVSVSDYDWGTLVIKNPDENISTVASNYINFCEQKPNLGDEIVVLGYPGIGSTISVTATDGIISGFDGSYFITSAKVEQGNSGGAAILLKDDCLLGIPTYASLGEVESLARILDIWTVVIK
ncbi:trypsin-like peptidase domain-containing protein [Patescibacteria group bacterium]|nr:trypsin-like peptidase domain-containing protein [Patescibacteria group bacterium]